MFRRLSQLLSTQGPSGGQAWPTQSASDDAPSRALHVAPRSVAHAACHAPRKARGLCGPLCPSSHHLPPRLWPTHSQKPLPVTWGSEWALGRRPAPTLDAADKLLLPAPAQECPPGRNDVQSGCPSRLQTNPPSPGTHPYQTGPEVVQILDHTGVCVCACVGITYRFVPRVKVMQSAILSK